MGLLPDELVEGFLSSWGMILVSEIGDKTFFIAAVMAMKNPRLLVRFSLTFCVAPLARMLVPNFSCFPYRYSLEQCSLWPP